jgi:hypothetical protein
MEPLGYLQTTPQSAWGNRRRHAGLALQATPLAAFGCGCPDPVIMGRADPRGVIQIVLPESLRPLPGDERC